MFQYILKRIFIFIPTLLVISLLTFGLSVTAPGDPVEQMLTTKSGDNQSSSLIAGQKAYLEKRKELGLDLPIFYFGISKASYPDTLHRIAKRSHKKILDRHINQYGNWEQISDYYNQLQRFELKVADVPKDSLTAEPIIKIKEAVQDLYLSYQDGSIKNAMGRIKTHLESQPQFEPIRGEMNKLEGSYNEMVSKATPSKNYIPSLNWYGKNNQYHRWFFGDKPWFGKDNGEGTCKGFLRGDFGISYQDSRPVKSVVWDALRWTVRLSFISIMITYLIAIPIGVYSARKKGSMMDQMLTTILFILYSIPSFWVATLAIVFLCGGDYFDIFPPYGVGGEGDTAWAKFTDRAYHLFLPLLCMTYGSFAYLSRQMRGGMINVLNQDYIRTARAKGLPENKVVWKHAIRNSLLPIITIFASVFPAMISGSIALEIIFSIPGMGKTAYEAVVARNYPIVYTVMMFSTILTLVGYLVSDILYAIVDPRISYSKKA